MKIDFAWLIESPSLEPGEVPDYWTGTAWTPDAFQAIKFPTQESAERVLAAVHDPTHGRFIHGGNVFVREHSFQSETPLLSAGGAYELKFYGDVLNALRGLSKAVKQLAEHFDKPITDDNVVLWLALNSAQSHAEKVLTNLQAALGAAVGSIAPSHVAQRTPNSSQDMIEMLRDVKISTTWTYLEQLCRDAADHIEQLVAQSSTRTIDRSEAVNLARNIMPSAPDYRPGEHQVTPKGIRCLAEAVLRMDEALSSMPSATTRGSMDPYVRSEIRQLADQIEECLPQEMTAEGLSFTMPWTRRQWRSILCGLRAAESRTKE